MSIFAIFHIYFFVLCWEVEGHS